MTRVDVVATERHYADHLAPIWLALPPSRRGRWQVAQRIYGHVIRRLGIPATAVDVARGSKQGGPVAVASYQDLRRVRPRPAVMVNHGAGQTYGGDPDDVKAAAHPSYSGGSERDHVALNICPGPYDLATVTDAQPDVPAVAVGCPKLDRYGAQPLASPEHAVGRRSRDGHRRKGKATVVVSFHADVGLCPESRWAWPHYGDDALATLRDDPRWTVYGHAHPRAWPHLRRRYDALDIATVEHFDDVLAMRPDLYVIDNSSTAYEAAAVDIPVLLLNAPWYRRDVHHGLRFWDLLPGVMCDRPDELVDAVADGLWDGPTARALRRTATAAVYAAVDGGAAGRAAAAICDTFGGNRDDQ